jgi:hypothetical protein
VLPANEQASHVAVVLEYKNGAVVSKHFTTPDDAIAFSRHSDMFSVLKTGRLTGRP